MAFDARSLVALGRVSSVTVSPDGRFIVCAVMRLEQTTKPAAKYVGDLWRVPLDGGPAVRLTFGDFNDRAPCFRRDGSIGFLSNRPLKGHVLESPGPQDADDEKRDQVWILGESGEPRPITDEPLGVQAFRFAAHGDALVVLAPVLPNVPDKDQRAQAKDLAENGPTDLHYPNGFGPFRHWDHWIGRAKPHFIHYDERGCKRRDLTPTAHRHYTNDVDFALSRDGSLLAVTQRVESEDRVYDQAIQLIDLRDMRSRVAVHDKQLEHGHPLFSSDGKRIYFVRHHRSPLQHGKVELCALDLATAEPKVLCREWDRWPVVHAVIATPGGEEKLVATADDEGTGPVFLITPSTGEVARVTSKSSGGTHESLAATPDGRIVGVRHTFRTPPEPFVIDAKPEQTPRMLASLSGFDARSLEGIAVSSFDVTGRDGARVQSWLVKPPKPDAPTVLWIHGGPVGAFLDAWHWRWNPMVLASAGYAVALPNPRGSTGFGTAFVEGIWRNAWGGACYDDVMAVADALEITPGIDGKRAAAMGGSFGGYMCNFIGGHTTRFRALITHASVFHLEAMTGASDYGPYFALEMGTTAWKDRAEFEKHSPHRFVSAWKTPTLVLHGEKDYRCPISEGLILFDALQEHHVPSELVVFPDENHWILKPRNIEAWYGHVLRFLREHL